MIERYQELLNECIDLTENKNIHKETLLTLETMKHKLSDLRRREICQEK